MRTSSGPFREPNRRIRIRSCWDRPDGQAAAAAAAAAVVRSVRRCLTEQETTVTTPVPEDVWHDTPTHMGSTPPMSRWISRTPIPDWCRCARPTYEEDKRWRNPFEGRCNDERTESTEPHRRCTNRRSPTRGDHVGKYAKEERCTCGQVATKSWRMTSSDTHG